MNKVTVKQSGVNVAIIAVNTMEGKVCVVLTV